MAYHLRGWCIADNREQTSLGRKDESTAMTGKKNPLGVDKDYFHQLSPKLQERLEKLDSWQLDFMEAKLGENPIFKTPSHIDASLIEYKRFMFFKGAEPDTICGMFSLTIDAIWHEHILYTRQYAEFCQSVFGHFVHHVPCNLLDLSKQTKIEYGFWIMEYQMMFGSLPSDLHKGLVPIMPSRSKVTGLSMPCG
jgi:hypothetical protein